MFFYGSFRRQEDYSYGRKDKAARASKNKLALNTKI
jgi:hypothetical protein